METPDQTQIVPSPGAEATLLGTTVTCPVCHTENAPGEKYCGDCGFLLSSTPGNGEIAVPGEQPRLLDPSAQREYLLKPGENSIGREGADVLLSNPTVSRRHALITLDDGKCWIEDSGSTNGTFVAGRQLSLGERVELDDGAELKFGSVALTLILPSAPAVSSEDEDSELGDPDAFPELEEIADAEEEADEEFASEAVAQPQVVARLVSESDPSIAYDVVEGANTIGRRPGNTIVISNDPYVSGSHALLESDESGFWFTDVGSTNGSVVNGENVQPNSRMPLNDGDKIVLGRTTLRFEIVGTQ